MIGKDFQEILQNYIKEKKKKYKDNKFAKKMRRSFKNDLNDLVSELVEESSDYKVKVSPGQDKWADIPWAGVREINTASSFTEGFYVVYLFKKDMTGVYLSLNQGNWKIKGNKSKILESRASKLREKIAEVPSGFNSKPIELKGEVAYQKLYEVGNVVSKFYDKNALNSEEIVKGDLNNILSLYGKLIPDYKEIVASKKTELKSDGKDFSKPLKIIKQLFKEFKKDYLDTEIGKDHLLGYDIERAEVNEIFNKIKKNKELFYNIDDPIINYLLPIKRKSVAPAGIGHIKAFGYTNKEIPGLTEAVFNFINDLINNLDETKQKDFIHSFKSGEYSKGIQSGIISSVLSYLNPNYCNINKKTVNTFNFLSKVLGENERSQAT